MRGIVSYGAYLPYHRLARSAIADALGSGGGKGTRAVASYDEDTTSLGVEAARAALRAAGTVAVDGLSFATANPAYLEKTNASAIHAAVGLPSSAAAFDVGGALRSGAGALLTALRGGPPWLVVTSDIRTGLPGGGDEANGGDAAAAFVVGDDDSHPVIAELIGAASATDELLDRWRLPGEPAAHEWEERFGEEIYRGMADQALTDALKAAGVTLEQVDHLAVCGAHGRAVRQVARSIGRSEVLAPDLTDTVGNPGTAQAGLLLASILDRAAPGDVVAVVNLADGVDVLVLRATEAIASFRPAATVESLIATAAGTPSYSQFLTWRGMLRREPPRRPDPVPPAAPPAHRQARWKFAFEGTRDQASGAVHLPPQRVSYDGGAVDHMDRVAMADVPATVVTFSVDRLAYSPSPPLVVAVIDFDGGGRFRCELTDVDPAAVAIGDRVEMTFRRMHTAGGIHNYFWKARPIRVTEEAS